MLEISTSESLFLALFEFFSTVLCLLAFYVIGMLTLTQLKIQVEKNSTKKKTFENFQMLFKKA